MESLNDSLNLKGKRKKRKIPFFYKKEILYQND